MFYFDQFTTANTVKSRERSDGLKKLIDLFVFIRFEFLSERIEKEQTIKLNKQKILKQLM